MITCTPRKALSLALCVTLFPPLLQAKPIQIIDGDAEAAAPIDAKESPSPILQHTLERLVSSLSLKGQQETARVANEVLAELCALPIENPFLLRDGLTRHAMKVCVNWGADDSLVEAGDLAVYVPNLKEMAAMLSQEKTMPLSREFYVNDDWSGSPRALLVHIAIAALSAPPSAEHSADLQRCCDLITDMGKMDTSQPLLHLFASLLPSEIKTASHSVCQPVSLLIRYLVAAGHNINTLNSQQQTVVDVILDQIFPHREKESPDAACTLYRRPTNLLGNGHDKGISAHHAEALSFLIGLGARHGSGYLHNTKRQQSLSAAAARRTALFLSTTPYTNIADALLSHHSEVLVAEAELLKRKEVLASIMNAAALSSNIHVLCQLANNGIDLTKHAALLWGALINPLHDPANIVSDARELLALNMPLNKRDAGGNTPLHFAVSAANSHKEGSPYWDLVALLMQHGASQRARNMRGQTPMSIAHGPLRSFMRTHNVS